MQIPSNILFKRLKLSHSVATWFLFFLIKAHLHVGVIQAKLYQGVLMYCICQKFSLSIGRFYKAQHKIVKPAPKSQQPAPRS
jgi:hypothetical protein